MALRNSLSIAFVLACYLSIASADAPIGNADPSIRVMGLFKNTAVVNLNGTQRILKVGKPAVDGVVLISADHKQAVIEFDGQQQTLTINNKAPISLSRSPVATAGSSSKSKSISLTRQPDGMFRVRGLINGAPVSFLVDTGATSVAMNHTTADRIGIPFRQVGTLINAKTASGIVEAYSVMLDKVRVGGIEMTNVSGAVLISEQPDEVLLGMSFLGRLKVSQDGKTMLFDAQ